MNTFLRLCNLIKDYEYNNFNKTFYGYRGTRFYPLFIGPVFLIFGLICLVVTLFYPDVRENITKGSPLSYIIVLILTVSLSQDLLPIYKLYKLLKSDSMPKKMPHIFKIINGEIQVVKRIQD